MRENIIVNGLDHGGNLPYNGTRGYNRATIDWYYFGPNVPENTSDINSRTSTWTHAHWFREHWGVVNSYGGKKAYQMMIFTRSDANTYFDQLADFAQIGVVAANVSCTEM